MDDCSLKSLKVKPGELSPAFNPHIVDYKTTVGSKVTKITILCETSDSGATVSVFVSISLEMADAVRVGIVGGWGFTPSSCLQKLIFE